MLSEIKNVVRSLVPDDDPHARERRRLIAVILTREAEAEEEKALAIIPSTTRQRPPRFFKCGGVGSGVPGPCPENKPEEKPEEQPAAELPKELARKQGESGQDWLDRLNDNEPEEPLPNEYEDGVNDVDFIRDRAEWKPKQDAWNEAEKAAKAAVEEDDAEEERRESAKERRQAVKEQSAWRKRQDKRDSKRAALEAKMAALQEQLNALDSEDADDAEPEVPEEKSADPSVVKSFYRAVTPTNGQPKTVQINGVNVLDVPDVRQKEKWDCGPACLESVMRYFNVAGYQKSLRPLREKSVPTVGGSSVIEVPRTAADMEEELPLVADILLGLFGEDAVNAFPPVIVEKAYEPCRDDRGRFASCGEGGYTKTERQQRSVARVAKAERMMQDARKGKFTEQQMGELGDHLLTMPKAELEQLIEKTGLKLPKGKFAEAKADLIARMGQRIRMSSDAEAAFKAKRDADRAASLKPKTTVEPKIETKPASRLKIPEGQEPYSKSGKKLEVRRPEGGLKAMTNDELRHELKARRDHGEPTFGNEVEGELKRRRDYASMWFMQRDVNNADQARKLVESELNAGKSVPFEVLADYPDLIGKEKSENRENSLDKPSNRSDTTSGEQKKPEGESTMPKKSLAERLADAKAKAKKQQHQNAIADRKAVSDENKKIREEAKTNINTVEGAKALRSKVFADQKAALDKVQQLRRDRVTDIRMEMAEHDLDNANIIARRVGAWHNHVVYGDPLPQEFDKSKLPTL